MKTWLNRLGYTLAGSGVAYMAVLTETKSSWVLVISMFVLAIILVSVTNEKE